MKLIRTVSALSALAHEGRLQLYRLLVAAGPEGLPVGDLGAALDMPGATLSFHLAQLKHAGLVTSKRDGRRLIQSADFERMNALVAFLTENCCGGKTCAPVCTPPKPRKKKARRD